MTKKNEEIMEILEAYDLTRCASSAADVHRPGARYAADSSRRPLASNTLAIELFQQWTQVNTM